MEWVLREDNEAAMRVMTTGRHPTLKHLHRVHGVGISSLHETVIKSGRAIVDIRYCPTDEMKADIYTQPFASGPSISTLSAYSA